MSEDKYPVKIRFLDGTIQTFKFRESATLKKVADVCCKFAVDQGLDKKKDGKSFVIPNGISFVIQIPRMEIPPESMDHTIKEMNLLNGSLLIVPTSVLTKDMKMSKDKFEAEIHSGDMDGPSYKLKGDDKQERERFEEKRREHETMEKVKEKKEKEDQVKLVRTRIQQDIKARKDV
jgi:hypothetical protein